MNRTPNNEINEISMSRIVEINHRLIAQHGEQVVSSRKTPLDELIFTVLSQHTNDKNRDRAWKQLKTGKQTWSTISNLPAKEIEKRIKVGGLARQKSKRILTILHSIRKDRGTIDLDFLEKLSDQEILRYLLDFPGVGPKTAACVLLFSMGRSAFPVDTHIHRIATRLGFLDKKTASPEAHQILGDLVPTEMYLTLHLNLISHGRKICRAQTPLCDCCILADICPKNI
jgi:endonuclease-3